MRQHKRCHSQTSSVETVMNLEELLTEILVRVPAFPLLLFKRVSKHWHSLISNPEFHLRHTRQIGQNPRPSLSAFFIGSTSNSFSSMLFPPHNNLISPRWNPLSVFANKHGHAFIVSSCNGLLLCRTSSALCFVLNPTTNRFLKLDIPQAQGFSNIWVSLAFDPSKSSHYKVICLQVLGRHYYNVLVYSSETRTWRKVSDSLAELWRKGYVAARDKEGVYWNGALHWPGEDDGDISYYHIEQDCVKFYKSDSQFFRKYKCENRDEIIKVSSERDDIIRVCKRDKSIMVSSGGNMQPVKFYLTKSVANYDVLEMGADYSGWFVKYSVCLGVSIKKPYFKGVAVLLVEDQYEDFPSLFVYTGCGGVSKVVSYNLKNGTRIRDLDLDIGLKNYLYGGSLASVE